MMCCQAPTPSPCSHRALQPHTSGTPPELDRAVFSPLQRQFFRAPTVLTGILPGNRAQASGLWRCFSSFGPGSPTSASTTLPYESWPCLLCRHQPCLSTGSSLQCPRVRPPLRHNPPHPPHHQQGQGRRNLYSIATSMAFPPCKPHFLSRLIYTLWSFHPLSSLTTQVFELT